MSIRCIVLAGGLGTRLRSVLPDLPKCLAPVNGRPFLERQLELLTRQGIDRFVLSLGYGADQVENLAAQWHGKFDVETVVEREPLGTGGAIRFAMESAGLDEALVINGDTWVGGDLSAMIEPLRQDELLRMAIVEVPDRGRFGGVAVNDEGRVERFIEKGQAGPGPINAGLYRVAKPAFGASDRGAFSFETQTMVRLTSAGQVRACQVGGPFIDIGVPDDYAAFCAKYGEFDGKRE
jgi:D-glycero-alpha-D-manno-heptose 1-phosphate guanylyltransferase